MKIAIDARIINSSTGRYVERLLYHLEDLDHDNDYLILVGKPDLDFYKPHNPRFKIVEASFEAYSLNEQVGFLRLLNRLKPDLVHFCMPQQPILYTGTHVTTVHDLILLNTYNSDKNILIYKFKQAIGRAVYYIIGRTSARILCPSNFTMEAYVRFARIDPAKMAVTYESTDFDGVIPEPYAPLEDKQFLLYTGQQSDYKNIRRLMEAQQRLRRAHPELLLVLVGRLNGKNGAPLVRNREWATRQGYAGIIFTDFLPDPQLRWLYQHCRAYVFPSLMEGFGLPGLEAMVSGAPVISSNATCLPEIYNEGALYFDPTNVVEMAQKINDVLRNPELRDELIMRGAKVAARYSWQRMAEQTLDVYQQALNEKRTEG
jgi:glycosyltransferase involved in cell wall biosynthesis